MITRVTITGADDSIAPAQLLELTRQYPFVEWGILVSGSSMGQSRFPSALWLTVLGRYQKALGNELPLSCHVCGRWVREMLVGNFKFIDGLTPDLWSAFKRVRINTHAEPHEFNPFALEALAEDFPEKEFIFQYDNVNKELFEYAEALAMSSNFRMAALFDLSHGAGRLPNEWPDLIPKVDCGYAGGLSPANLFEQIKRIEEKAGETPIWIDMETHVRSNNDQLFDLDKVRTCLEIASEFIETYKSHD